jgi:hypothetical protein
MVTTVPGYSVSLVWADKDVPKDGVLYQASHAPVKNPFLRQ